MHDLVIRGGNIVDGSGRAAYRGDVAIEGGRIVEVGEVAGSAWRTLDADGLVVTPGFIDPHTHLDAQLMWDPLATPVCWHGVTSVVIGNCGVSFAPLAPRDRELLARVLESVEEIPAASMLASLNFRWESYADYLGALAAQPLGVNVGGLVGHAATRYYAMGEASLEEGRAPSDAELSRMREQVRVAVAAGALGFSTSRTTSHATPEGVPIPGTYAETEELVALASAMGERGVVQWVAGFGERDRGPEFPRVRQEVTRMAEVQRASGRPVIFSMFTHPQVPTLHTSVLAWADAERAAGAKLRPMFNPRIGTSLVGLANRSPVRGCAWKALYERPLAERRRALEDAATRRALCEVSAQADARAGAELHRFGPERCNYERRPEERVGAIAAQRGERPVETVVRLLRETGGRQVFAVDGANQIPAHIEEVFFHGDTLLGLGDAGAHVGSICDASMTTHALSYWCRERGLLSLEEAVRRLTSDPADAFGIGGRGRLELGAHADVNVIDFAALEMEPPEFVHDFPAGAGRWTQRARGYAYTLVNGEVAIEQGRHTGRLAGSVLRSG